MTHDCSALMGSIVSIGQHLGGDDVARRTVHAGEANREAHRALDVRRTPRLETNMENTKKRMARAQRHAERLGRAAVRDAGSRTDVARALGRSRSTVSHEATTRSHPELKRALEIAVLLNGGRGTSARPLAEAMAEAVELSDIVTAEDATLITRGCYLLDREDLLEADENRAAKTGVGYAEALRAEASAQFELAQIIDELAYRKIDLLALHRQRAVRA